MTMRDNTIEAVKKGDKGAFKTEDGWQSLSEATSGDPGPATFIARRLQTFKAPAAQANADSKEEMASSMVSSHTRWFLY